MLESREVIAPGRFLSGIEYGSSGPEYVFTDAGACRVIARND
ncbi:MAG: hypothetical protein NWR72_08625 [Bacteroidia bacterium]|nr:hypothetical protein [Bacteroidia bacterium]